MRFCRSVQYAKTAVVFTILLSVFYSHQSFSKDVNVENLSAETLTKILDNFRGRPYENFNRFALDVYITGKRFFDREQHNAIGDFVASKRLSPKESFIVHRLLGVYTRLKYGGEARRMLAKLVSIPSFRKDGIEQHKNVNFIRLEKVIAAYAKEFGLKYKNVGGRVYEVSLRGRGGVLIGLHAHGDVVPANSELWVLDDGAKLNPFKMTQVGNKLYGRGTQDNKNGIVASMFAMRTIKEEKIKLFNDFKLLVDTTEETSSSTIPYYFERRGLPNYNIDLDGSYPVTIAEKGFGGNPNGRWLNAMLDIAAENLELPREFGSSSGGTSILKNDVQFGLSRPDEKYTGHNAKEFKTIDQFLLDLQIVTEMIMRVGLMRNLD